MNSNVLVIGNGFDLAFGLKTHYKDFVNSEKWPFRQKNKNAKVCLQNFFVDFVERNQNVLGEINWIDIEDLLLQYAMHETKSSEWNSSIVKDDKIAYYELCKSFNEYLNQYVEPCISKNCLRFPYMLELINSIKKNGTFNRVYTFNYTSTSKILQYFSYKPKVTHIHGLVNDENHPPILGVSDRQQIPKEYCFLRKSWHDTFEYHDINDALSNSEQCIFYGLSFGKSDFVYFERFFKEIIQNHTSKKHKKSIHIFTYNEESRENILLEFDEASISISDLKSVCKFNIYKSNEYVADKAYSFNQFRDFLAMLEDTKLKQIDLDRIARNVY